MAVHEQKSSESKRESRNPKGEQQHRSKKRLPSKHTHTQFYRVLLVRSGRFRFVAPKSEGTAFLYFFLFSFFFFQAVDYLLSVKPNARTSLSKSYYPVDRRGSIYNFISSSESPLLLREIFYKKCRFRNFFFFFFLSAENLNFHFNPATIFRCLHFNLALI